MERLSISNGGLTSHVESQHPAEQARGVSGRRLDFGDVRMALELISGADVFVTNVRPGALRRPGFDFESIAPDNPRLVYGLITGYGETGPDADRASWSHGAHNAMRARQT